MSPLLYMSNLKQQIKQILCRVVVLSADFMQILFWNNQPSYIIIKMTPLTTYQHCLTFSCSRKWPELSFHVTSLSMYSNHTKTHSWHVPKTIIINSDIAIWSFIYVLIWGQNVHLILLSIANNVIYFKFVFWGSFLLCQLIWDSLYCRSMICYLCFRRHMRFCRQVVYCITIQYHICCIDK